MAARTLTTAKEYAQTPVCLGFFFLLTQIQTQFSFAAQIQLEPVVIHQAEGAVCFCVTVFREQHNPLPHFNFVQLPGKYFPLSPYHHPSRSLGLTNGFLFTLPANDLLSI